MAKSTRKSLRKQVDSEKAGGSSSSKQIEPLALVFYTLDRTVGVVERSGLEPSDALVGSVASAPLPLGYPEPKNGEMLEVMIVMLGYSLAYLNAVPVDEDGVLIAEQIYSNSIVAVKKSTKAEEKRVLNQGISKIDRNITAFDDLSQQYKSHNDQNGKGTESHLATKTVEVIEVSNKVASSNTEPEQLVPHNAHQCAVADVIKTASPDNIEFLEKLIKAIKKHRQEEVEGNNKTDQQAVGQQATTQTPPPVMEEKKTNPPPDPSADDAEQPENPPQEASLEDVMQMLPCFKVETQKVPLVEMINVFVYKWDYASIPAVAPRLPIHKGLKQAPEGGLFPRGMVKHLIDLMIPDNIQARMTPQDIPEMIKKAISTYINYRLIGAFKITDAQLHEYLYDICRKKKK